MKKILAIILTIFTLSQLSGATLEPFSKKLRVSVSSYRSSSTIKVPIITWGADIVTIHANGSSAKTSSGSLFRNNGLNIELFREDDFEKQVERYLKGETPFLRGTMGMINMAADIANRDNRTKLVVVYQHSWSAGGDALVVKSGIKSVKDLRGKTIAIQKYGPHVDYLMKLLKDAGLGINDVNIVWTNDFIGPEGDTPMAKFYGSGIDAAFVITPDALALTSNGTVGTGAEDSVKGARILLSTKTANRIISDVYAVRKDYFDKNKKEVEMFVKALLKAEEEVRDLFKRKSGSEYRKLISASAQLLLDSSQATGDTEGLYFDAEVIGYNGNVSFFSDSSNLRNFDRLNSEIQSSFMNLGLVSSKQPLLQASWDYNSLRSGLKYATTKSTQRFDEEEVSSIITKRQQMSLDEGELFAFEIYFQPNQNEFSADLYREQFQKVLEYASTYGGAIITIEGHSDPMGYLRKEKEGQSSVVLNRIKQAAKNLSLSRANKVRDEIISYAQRQGITLDTSQFASVGLGITKPHYAVPKTKKEWLANMRVVFKIIQIEAEEDVFVPLD